MSDTNTEEVITEEFFWFRKGGDYSKEMLEYQALKLTNEAKTTLVSVEMKKDGSDWTYSIVSTGSKQKLLLLKFMIKAWLWGAIFVTHKNL